MKRNTLFFMLLFSLFFSKSSNAQMDTMYTGVKGKLNPIFYLQPYEAITYINNYREKKKRRNKTHSRSVFLTKETFLFISQFFQCEKNAGFDGLRMHLVMYKQKLALGQVDPKQIALYMAPTVPDQKDKSKCNYEALKHFFDNNDTQRNSKCNHSGIDQSKINEQDICMGNCDKATNPIRVGIPATEGKVGVMWLNDGNISEYKRNYRNRYCILNKFHTKSVWLRKENFDVLGQFFVDNPSYDGIRVFFASYNKWMEADVVRGQARKKQITFILTPTIDREPKFDVDFQKYLYGKYWMAFYDREIAKLPSKAENDASLKRPEEIESEKQKKVLELIKIKFKTFLDNFNHGTLCPSSCPIGE